MSNETSETAIVAVTTAQAANGGAKAEKAERFCPGCQRPRPLADFRKNPHARSGFFNKCVHCLSNAGKRRWVEAHAAAAATAPYREYGRSQDRAPGTSGANRTLTRADVTTASGGYPVEHGEHGEHGEITLRPGEGVIRHKVYAPWPPNEGAAPEPAPEEKEPTPWESLAARASVSLYEWLADPACAARGEAFLIPTSDAAEGAVLIHKQGSTYYLLSADAEHWPTPEKPIDPDVLLYVVRIKAGLPGDADVWGVRFA